MTDQHDDPSAVWIGAGHKAGAVRYDDLASVTTENADLAGQVAALRGALTDIASCESYHPDDVVAIARAALTNTAAAAASHDARIRRAALARAVVAINGCETITEAAQAINEMMGETNHG